MGMAVVVLALFLTGKNPESHFVCFPCALKFFGFIIPLFCLLFLIAPSGCSLAPLHFRRGQAVQNFRLRKANPHLAFQGRRTNDCWPNRSRKPSPFRRLFFETGRRGRECKFSSMADFLKYPFLRNKL